MGRFCPLNPNGDYLYGIGDADIQAAVIHDLDTRWAVDFGMRLITPTGADPPRVGAVADADYGLSRGAVGEPGAIR